MINIPKELVFLSNHASVIRYPPNFRPGYYTDSVLPLGVSKTEKNVLSRAEKKNSCRKEQFSNKPIPGFFLQKSLGSNSLWSVIDPRGYDLSITSKNVDEILSHSSVASNIIEDECVWVRDDNSTKLSLVPVSHPRYAEYVENTRLIENAPDTKPNIGDKVYTQYGITGTYMGKMSLYSSPIRGLGREKDGKVPCARSVHVLEVSPGRFFYNKHLRPLGITDCSSSTDQGILIDLLNKTAELDFYTNDPGSLLSSSLLTGSRFDKHKITHISKVDTVPIIRFEPIGVAEATELMKGKKACSVLIRDSVGSYFVPKTNNFLISKPTDRTWPFYVVDAVSNVNDNNIANSFNKLKFDMRSELAASMLSDPKLKFYKIIKQIKNETYI